MPTYTETIKQIIFEDDVRKMWKAAKYEHERVLLSLLWFSGARPAEILGLKRKNVNWGIGEDGADFFEIKLETKKLARAEGFVVTERILRSSRPMGAQANIYIETIIKWAMHLQPEDWMVFHRSRMSINRTMHRLSAAVGHVWSAYHFRHSVFTHLARNNMSLSTLMYWKGAADIMSVKQYIQATPVYMRIENQRRERDLSAPRVNYERYAASVNKKQVSKEEAEKIPEGE